MELVEKKYVRRNIISLKETYPSEFGRFIHALRNLQLSDDWSRICGIHGNTFKPDDKGVKCPTDPAIVEKIGNTPDEPFYCAHSQTKFAVFHTVYIYQFELLLNKYNTSNGDNYITLPYLFLENNGTDYSFMNETNITILFDNQEITIENPLAPQNVYYFDTKGEKKTVQRNGSLTPKNLTEIQKLDVINKELNNVLYAERYPTFSSNTLFNNILHLCTFKTPIFLKVFILFPEYNKKLIYNFIIILLHNLYELYQMNQTNGYIYVRNHPSYDVDDACKMGKANNIPERDTQYATGEIKRGYFEAVFEVPIEKMGIVERLLQNEFRELNVKYDAGTEFYKKKIITLIEPYLIILGIKYKKLSKQEISDLVRCNRVRKTIKKINIQSLIHILKSKRTNKQIVSYIPRNDQTIIIGKSVIHFQQYDKGMLILMCGVGKTLISLWITQELNSNTILIGVPNKLLLKQWEEVICVLFQSVPYLIVSGGVDTENIMRFLENNQKKCIVITTYSSAHKVYTATQDTRFVFGMKILDEVHHLTTNNMRLAHTTKKYIQMLNIPSVKQLSLTATLKQLESMCDDGIVVSNDNVEYFGEIIDRKCLLWAINENIICDYVIQTIITNEEQLEQQLSRFHIIEENDKRLFLSAFASLKSIFDGHSHHLLIYSNNKDNSLKLIQYIKMLLDDSYFDIPDLYYSNYHSEMKSKDQKEIINNFEKAKFGIITCVYCLGEGWDFPLLDGVVFAENMTSNIRIVQSALRASRKNKNDINKKTKIILPILNRDDWLENNENPDLKKVREVIYQMGLEDETITQKIKVFRIEIEKQKPKPREKEEREIIDAFGEYDDELTQKLRLKTIKRTALATTYEKARKIIADKNIKSKESYYELCERYNRLSKEPEITFKGQFTNWIEYLSIERVYYDLETCKNKVGEYLLLYPEIKKHYLDLLIVSNELVKIDKLFPPNGLWVEYYNVKDLRDIITITNKKKKMGVIL